MIRVLFRISDEAVRTSVSSCQEVRVCNHRAVRAGGHLAQVKMCVLDTPAQCICYNPDGTMLAVGLGGGLVSDSGEWSIQGESQARGLSFSAELKDH